MKKITLSGIYCRCVKFVAIISFMFASEFINAQQYTNGNLSTGTLTKSGVLAPTNYTWSEMQNDAGVTTISNGTTGVGGTVSSGNRIADDFTIPAGQQWALSKITFYGYQSDYTGATSPFSDVRVRIQNAIPSSAGSVVVFGDLTTNRLLTTSDAMMYRIPNTIAPAPVTPLTNRKIWKIEATVAVTLQPGTYWIEFQIGTTTGASFVLPSTIVNSRTQPGYNAIQWVAASAVWNTLLDPGNPPDTSPDVAIDIPFIIDYTSQLNTIDNKLAAFSIFPNPVKDQLTIDSGRVLDGAEIFDITGRLVKGVSFVGTVINQIDVSALSSGNYILKVDSGGEKSSQKFIKD